MRPLCLGFHLFFWFGPATGRRQSFKKNMFPTPLTSFTKQQQKTNNVTTCVFFTKMPKIRFPGLRTLRLAIWTTCVCLFYILSVFFTTCVFSSTLYLVELSNIFFQKWRTQILKINFICNSWDISGRKH